MRLALPGQSRVLRRALAVTVSFLVLFAAFRVGEAIYYANVSAPQISQRFGFTLTSPYLVLDQPGEWREVAQFSSIYEGGPLAHAGFRGGDILKDMQIHNFHRSLHQLKKGQVVEVTVLRRDGGQPAAKLAEHQLTIAGL